MFSLDSGQNGAETCELITLLLKCVVFVFQNYLWSNGVLLLVVDFFSLVEQTQMMMK